MARFASPAARQRGSRRQTVNRLLSRAAAHALEPLEGRTLLSVSMSLTPVGTVNEGSAFTLNGSVTGLTPSTAYTLDVDWGDPSLPNNSETISITTDAAGSKTFSKSHVYLDDNPSGTPGDRHTVKVLVDGQSEQFTGYADFSDTTGLTLSGTAAAVNTPADGDVLRLTEASQFQAGAAFTTAPLSVASGFSTSFAFRISDIGHNDGVEDADGADTGGDGLTFTLQSAASNPAPLGSMGYEGLKPSVAVEFDTFQNIATTFSDAQDVSSNHVGIDTNGRLVSVAAADVSGLKFDDGSLRYAWIDYDGTTLQVRVSGSPTRPTSPTLSYNIDLPAVIGTNNVYVGFTAGTGGAWGAHDVTKWQFQDTIPDVGASTKVTVQNVVPTLSGLSATTTDENGFSTLTGTVADPGKLDTFELNIDWGNGDTQTVPLSASATGSQTFSITHQYLDDDPSGTPSDTYTIHVSVADDDPFIGLTNGLNPAGLTLSGDAAVVDNGTDGNVVRLAQAESFRAGSAFSTVPVDVAGGFSTRFAFRISDSGGYTFDDTGENGGDGFTFTLQTETDSPNTAGFGLGYGGLTPSLAVEFDTFQNLGHFGNDDVNDPSSNHIGIDQDGNLESVATMDMPDLKLDSGDLRYAWIDYDGTNLQVRVSDTDTRPASPTLSYPVDLGAALSQSSAFIGFTAATGGAWGNHDIVSWQFQDTASNQASASTTVTVNNVAPTVSNLSAATIDENGVTTLTGTLTDPGTLDTFSLTIDWGDGNTQTVSLGASAPGSQNFSINHQYLDDNPSGTPSDQYTISVTATDDDQFVGLTDGLNPAGLTLSGDASIVDNGTDGQVLRLAPAVTFKAGSAFSTVPVDVAGGFSSNFAFRISDAGGPTTDSEVGGDGFTFTLQSQTNSPNTPGYGLGYAGLTPSIAVEFDTFQNMGLYTQPDGSTDNVHDISTNHLGIDLNGSLISVDAVDMPALKFDNGDLRYAWVDYDGSRLDVRVSDTDTRPVDPTLSYPVDLQSLLGPNAFIGFTASTGGAFGNHDIVSWQFQDTTVQQSQATTTVRVNNVAPVLSALTSDSQDCGDIGAGQSTTLSATFTDVGTLDTHTASIAWGDGTTSAATITESGGSGSMSASHTYASVGAYAVSVTLSDDDTGTSTQGTTLFIGGGGVRVAGGILQIIGTRGDDQVQVSQQGSGTITVSASFLPSAVIVPSAGLTGIYVRLCDGNDKATISSGVNLPAVVLGDGGNDTLNGGRKSLLIGGTGKDRLVGGPDNDVLVGSSVNPALSIPTLFNIAKGISSLSAADVINDGEADTLNGGAGTNTLFA